MGFISLPREVNRSLPRSASDDREGLLIYRILPPPRFQGTGVTDEMSTMGPNDGVRRREFLHSGALALGGIGVLESDAGGGDGESRAWRPVPLARPSDLSTVSTAVTRPERATGIRPGTLLVFDNPEKGRLLGSGAFIWTSTTGNEYYIGTAGHAVLPNPGDVTVFACDGCAVGGAAGVVTDDPDSSFIELGEVVYASYADELGGDFALVKIPPEPSGRVDPSMPTFGGPDRVENTDAGDRLCHYGNGVLFGETFASKGRVGVSTGSAGGGSDPDAGGWWQGELAAFQGDSGSPVAVARAGTDGTVGVRGAAATGIVTRIRIGEPSLIGGPTVAQATAMVNGTGDGEESTGCRSTDAFRECRSESLPEVEPVLVEE